LTLGYDYIVDEKNHNVSLTNEGVLKCEKILGVENLYNDMESEWVHHIVQALKAHNLFKKDVDYVVKDNEIIIVDEFTGRLMPGRRWSDGLHQAIEAKENVEIAEENQTLATITFQNFFRMYNKLAGMTGTALTEAEEFFEIYKLDVVEVPTNKSVSRQDFTDVIYRTEREKYNAIIKDIAENRKIGRPILVGTKSIEKSEYLSSLLKKSGIPHQVLNAKYHEQEANIISQAGRKGNVTIATNMAGRGTDIVLGGNPVNEEESQIVKSAGGLYIIGTERHDSRRIDNQLRGRAGRQGDPGASRFYISLEDDLMRLFGTDKSALFSKLGLEEGQDIQHPWISKAIASAQRRVEGMNFDIRKQLIEFDNVMNKQREVVYKQRDVLLFADNLESAVDDIIEDVVEMAIDEYIPLKSYPEQWDMKGLCSWININTNSEIDDLEECKNYPREGVLTSIKDLLKEIYSEKKKDMPQELILELQRVILLQVVDNCWKEHLYNLDQLRKVIGFRAYGQKDPVLEYKNEAFKMFVSMINRIKQSSFEYIFKTDMSKTILVDRNESVYEEDNLNGKVFDRNEHGNIGQDSHKLDKIGRNDLCPCGSGKKFKKCCGQNL
jgi:preprotein translocase subunit SecA